MKNELDSFVEAVRKGQRPKVSGLDGLKSLEVAVARSKSAAEGAVCSI